MLLLEAGPDFLDFNQLPDMLKPGWGTVNLEARAAGSPGMGTPNGSSMVRGTAVWAGPVSTMMSSYSN